MAAKADTSALLLPWKLQGPFDLVVIQAAPSGGRTKNKLMGTVSDIHDTEKGRVENKTNQVLMLLQTTKQAEHAAPYALQVANLDFSGLRKDLLTEYKKKLPDKPSLIQIARKTTFQSLVYASQQSHVLRQAEEGAQEVDEGA